MASMNKVFLMGNLGADPEVRFTNSGAAVANFRMATTEVWNDRNSGQRQERTEWHRIVAWGKTAELCGEYLKKGRACLVEGRIQTREWEDKAGAKRYTTEIVADRVTFVGGRDDAPRAPAESSDERTGGGYGRRRGDGGGQQRAPDGPPPLGDQDIPF